MYNYLKHINEAITYIKSSVYANAMTVNSVMCVGKQVLNGCGSLKF